MTDAAGAGEAVQVPPIRTRRLDLVSLDIPVLEALERGDVAAAGDLLGAAVPDDLPADLADFVRFRLDTLRVDPSRRPWLGRAMVLDEPAGRRVVGIVGFHDAPDAEGRAEIGYRVDAAYRRRGYALEAVEAVFDWAAERGATRFVASVSPDNEASLALIERFGFVQTGSQIDEIDGLELVFETTWPPSG